MKTGPGMIRDENGRLSGYVYVDVAGRDIGSYVHDAKQAVAEAVKVPGRIPSSSGAASTSTCSACASG